jgi:hypothetical protein
MGFINKFITFWGHHLVAISGDTKIYEVISTKKTTFKRMYNPIEITSYN